MMKIKSKAKMTEKNKKEIIQNIGETLTDLFYFEDNSADKTKLIHMLLDMRKVVEAYTPIPDKKFSIKGKKSLEECIEIAQDLIDNKNVLKADLDGAEAYTYAKYPKAFDRVLDNLSDSDREKFNEWEEEYILDLR